MVPFDISPVTPLPEPEIFVDVAIAGAGLGGLALAVGLQERGFESVMLFEAVPYSRSQTGTIFAMFPNGAKALEGLKPGRRCDWLRCNGQKRVSVAERPGGSESSNDSSGEGDVEAVDVVFEVVGSTPETDKTNSTCSVSGGGETPKKSGGAMEQYQRQLVVVRAKILVAADGVRSAVRNQMIGDSPRYLEQIGWNALVPNPPSARVYPQEHEELLFYMDEVMGYQMYLIDIGHGKTFWQVRVLDPDSKLKSELKLTPFGGFGKPGVNDRLMCHVSKNIADPSGHDIWHTVLQAVTVTDPGNIYERYMVDRPPPKDSWSDPKCGNRVVLMGDAAHAMHTGPGQGAQMAFEDAHQLSMCLADVKDVFDEPAAVAAAVREYEARRIDRCVRVHAYATGSHGFGEEGKLVKALSPPEKMKRFMEFRSWVHAYPDKIKGDPESTYFK
ncbi:unnamed protein product [Closterium sp. Yama58-4]|nr:unnamed protein product [Closterium sp. Yama58-4]